MPVAATTKLYAVNTTLAVWNLGLLYNQSVPSPTCIELATMLKNANMDNIQAKFRSKNALDYDDSDINPRIR